MQQFPRRPSRPLSLLVFTAVLAGCLGEIGGPAGEGPLAPEPAAARARSPGPAGGAPGPGPAPAVAPNPPPAPPAAGNPFRAACTGRLDAAPAPARRLSKREYANTLADLFGARLDVASITKDFPDDTIEAGFDNVARNLSSAHVEAALTVADRISRAVTAASEPGKQLLARHCRSTAAPLDAACAREIVAGFGLRAFRRPLSQPEKDSYARTFADGAQISAAEGLRRLLLRFLIAPDLFYRLELGGAALGDRPDLVALGPHELAARLSFAVTGSTPDDPLLAAAADGSLASPDGFRREVDRLFATPRARASVRHFALQALGLAHEPDDLSYSRTFLAGVDAARLAAQAAEELLTFVDALVFDRRGGFEDLFTSDFTTASKEPLLTLYRGGRRAGVLTRATFLMSRTDRTELVHRGLRIRENLLCDPIPSPNPADFPPGALGPPPPDGATSTRQRFESKTAPAACAACHGRLNPLGFALEGYDGLGRFREHEDLTDARGAVTVRIPIDARVVPHIESAAEAPVDGVVELQAALARSPKARACMARQWLTFARGRAPGDGDACALADLYDLLAARADGAGGLLAAMKRAVLDPGFRVRKLED